MTILKLIFTIYRNIVDFWAIVRVYRPRRRPLGMVVQEGGAFNIFAQQQRHQMRRSTLPPGWHDNHTLEGLFKKSFYF